MDLDVDELFGRRESGSRRNSIASGSDGGGSASEREDFDEDDGGRNNPMEEALEVPDRGAAPAAEAAKVVKPKRVIQNPVPKLDNVRISGPRGIPAIQKIMKKVQFKGKGHEKEDLEVLMKNLEHWAHRMYPRFPFKNIVEQLEKLGSKKPVQNMMKRYRLDMFDERPMGGEEVEDDVLRGIDEEKEPEPIVDVFDELLGPAFPSSNIPPTTFSQPTTVPARPKPATLTHEQKERIERNKRIAAEKRLARLKEQQELEQQINNRQNELPSVSTDQIEEMDVEATQGNTSKGSSDKRQVTSSLDTDADEGKDPIPGDDDIRTQSKETDQHREMDIGFEEELPSLSASSNVENNENSNKYIEEELPSLSASSNVENIENSNKDIEQKLPSLSSSSNVENIENSNKDIDDKLPSLSASTNVKNDKDTDLGGEESMTPDTSIDNLKLVIDDVKSYPVKGVDNPDEKKDDLVTEEDVLGMLDDD